MLDDIVDIFESGGIIKTVADAFVGDHLEINVFALDNGTVAQNVDLEIFFAKGQEHGQVAEIVNVMINGGDAERPHAGDDH